MQPERGSARARELFAEWVQDVVDAYAEPPRKWSMSRLARESGVHRNNLYDWINQKAYPQAATLRRFCDGLGLDYTEPARLLGWADAAKPDPHRASEESIERAKKIAAHPKTSEERRRVLNERIENAEAALRMQRMADELLRDALGEDVDR